MHKYNFPNYLTLAINDYLMERTFKIRVSNHVTDEFQISCGVPQGGVLSPVLFSIYINDIPINEANDEHSMLFADDLAEMYIVDVVSEETSKYINLKLKNLENWLNKWRLKMAPNKCNYVVFSKNKKTGYKETLDIELYGTKIQQSQEQGIKFLGIRFDKHFSFKNQIEHLKSVCQERMNILKIISHRSWKLDTKTLVNTYKLLIRSVIDYSLYLYDILSETNKQYLQKIQNRCLRIVLREYNMNINELHENCNLE